MGGIEVAMKLEELKALIADGESSQMEFKRSTGQRSDAAKAVCGMLNGAGGYVVFGVDDKGAIIGQHISSKTLEDISNEIRRIDPPAFPTIDTVILHGELE
jgi:ATP-dependent DNA helicase RecG